MSKNSGQFKKGNPGKLKGTKNKRPGVDICERLFEENSEDLCKFVRVCFQDGGRHERMWAADYLKSLLPKNVQLDAGEGLLSLTLNVNKIKGESG